MLMDAKRVDDLKRLYSLFMRVNALELLRQALGSYIRGMGQGIIMDEEKDKDLVPCLLDFKSSLDTILEESFSKNEAFSNTIKDSFEHLINLRQVFVSSNPDLHIFYLPYNVFLNCICNMISYLKINFVTVECCESTLYGTATRHILLS